MSTYKIENHFEGKDPIVWQIYNELMTRLSLLGPVTAAPKKTSIHLDNKSGFAGVYTRKSYILLHFRLAHQVEDPRISKIEKHSAHRFMHTVTLRSGADIDNQLVQWLKEAYELAG
ncbi:MAG: hypothetical protein H6670_17650 [Anaerolineaceae bacterium]|nr:hypothetical protein [Anaerolineaceae bacterium]